MIIHYVADIHQPLHAVVGISEEYPSGDHGGNYESLPSLCTASNLHAVWDSVLYDYCDRPDLVSTHILIILVRYIRKIHAYPIRIRF